MDNNKFSFIMPAQIEKSATDDRWRIRGLASTEDVDQQGEIIIQKGIDLTPIDKKQGYLNLDHKPGVENLVGTVDGYAQTPKGLVIEGTLFKNHDKARVVQQIMSSLGEGERGRVGLSVEGRILERDPQNPRIIRKCSIKNVAITFSPVNAKTHADLVKSMNGSALDFQATEENLSDATTPTTAGQPVFTADQVVELMQKAMAATSAAATNPPTALSGGDALGKEDLAKKPVKVEGTDEPAKDAKAEKPESKKLKPLTKSLYKSNMSEILDKIQVLYPDNTRAQLWSALQTRLNERFPDLKDILA